MSGRRFTKSGTQFSPARARAGVTSPAPASPRKHDKSAKLTVPVGELDVKLDGPSRFMVTFEPDPEVLTPGKDAQAFLLVRYTLGAV